MVQVINRTPGMGEMAGKGFSKGFSESLDKRLQTKRQTMEMEEGIAKLDALGDLEKMDDFTLQREIYRAFPNNTKLAQGMSETVFKRRAEQKKVKKEKKEAQGAAKHIAFLEKKAGVPPGSWQDMPVKDAQFAYKETVGNSQELRAARTEQRQEKKFEREIESDQADIDFVKENYGINAPTGKTARSIIRSKEQKLFEPALQKGSAQEILTINKGIRERGESAKRVMPALKAARITNKKNVTGLGSMGTILFNLTGNEVFKSGDAALIDASVKELLGDLRKDIIGGRASQQEFLTMLGFVPGLGKTMKANENLFNFFITMKEMDLAEDDMRKSYIKEIGGISKAGEDFESQIAERTESIRDGIWEAYQPVLHGKKDLFEQALKRDPSLRIKQKVISPSGDLLFIDKSKVKKARDEGFYIYGR